MLPSVTHMLNDTKIKKLKPEEKTYRIADQGGLCLEVRPTGSKLWRVRYRFNGKASMISLGEYPAVGLADARQRQEEIKTLLANDVDPAAHKLKLKIEKKGKDLNTFKAIANEYITERLQHKSEKYIEQFSGCLEKDVYPVIGEKNIKEVTSADVLKIMQSTIKRVRSQNNFGTGEVTAINNRKFIGAVMRYAIATLRAENDPTYAVREVVVRPDVNHARPLTKEERRQAREKLEIYAGSETVKNAGFLLLYTMLRTIEIRRMQWDWVDFDDRVVSFPKEVMKKKRPHILPMSEQVYGVLKKQHLNSGNKQLVFPAIFNTSNMLNQMTLNRMLEYIGLKEVSAHDFRATTSTLLNEIGYDEKWIEKQLAHAESNKTKASYDHSRHLKERRKMLQDWADIVDSWKE